ncbi:MAG: alkaline shock response membrane anchor protein AmaP, partial [Chloroflexi bacterium]|nr:alkaline shock response membrane anchor protein AmaP [Chloroflexota bacterium]
NRGVAFFDANVTDTAGWFSRWFLPIGAAILLLLLVLLYLEIRKTQHKAVRIQTQDGGNARLDISSVAQSVEYRVDELAGVRKVKTRITSRGKDVDVAVDLDTSPSVNIPALTDQIIAMTHEIVEGQLGIRIHGRPVINIKHEPYPRGTMPTPAQAAGTEYVNATPPAANGKQPAPSYSSNLGLGEAFAAEGLTSPEAEADRGVEQPAGGDTANEV